MADTEARVRAKVAAELRRRAVMTQQQREVDDARKHIEETLLTDKCANCGAAWFDFGACAAVRCGNCPNHFCACCCEDFGPGAAGWESAHAHVPHCAHNPRPGKVFAPPAEIRAQRPALWQPKLDAYVAALAEDMRPLVLAACREVVLDRGLRMPVAKKRDRPPSPGAREALALVAAVQAADAIEAGAQVHPSAVGVAAQVRVQLPDADAMRVLTEWVGRQVRMDERDIYGRARTVRGWFPLLCVEQHTVRC